MRRRAQCGVSGAVIMAGGLVILAMAPNWPVMLLAAGVFGVGFGMHAGVNVALAVASVPTRNASGTFLGVLQDAIFLALIASPLIGGWILTAFPQQFVLLFGAAAVVSVLAGVALVPLRRDERPLASLSHTHLEEQ